MESRVRSSRVNFLLGVILAGSALVWGGVSLIHRVEERAELKARERLARERLVHRIPRPEEPQVWASAIGRTPVPLPTGRTSNPQPASAEGKTPAASGSSPYISGITPLPVAAPVPVSPSRPPRTTETETVPGVRPPDAEFNRIAVAAEPYSPKGADPAEDAESAGEVRASDDTRSDPGARQLAGYVGLPPGSVTSGSGGQSPSSQAAEPTADEPPSSAGGGSLPTLMPEGAMPRVTLLPSSSFVGTGQSVQVLVQIDGGQDVGSVPFQVQFDGRLLQFERAFLGDYLSRTGASPLLLAAPLQEGNEIAVGISKPGSGAGGSGSGTLLTLEFRAIGPGTSPLKFSQEKLLDSRSREVPAQFVSSQVTVR